MHNIDYLDLQDQDYILNNALAQVANELPEYMPHLQWLDLAIHEPAESDYEYSDLESACSYSSEETEYSCRICLGGIDPERDVNKIVSPCNCKGSAGYIHIACFNKLKKNKCQTCHFKMKLIDYKIISRLQNGRDDLKRLVRHLENVLHEISAPQEEDRNQGVYRFEPLQVLNNLPFQGEEELVFDIPAPQFQHIANLQFQPVQDGNINGMMNLLNVGDMWTQFEQMLPILGALVPGQPEIIQTLRNGINNARNFWINNEEIRYIYFIYFIMSDLYPKSLGFTYKMIKIIGLCILFICSILWILLREWSRTGVGWVKHKIWPTGQAPVLERQQGMRNLNQPAFPAAPVE